MTAVNMTLNEYQNGARLTAIYREQVTTPEDRFVYTSLGLNGEAGEVAEHAKKMIRDDAYVFTRERRAQVRKELGDALWYIAMCADDIGVSLGELAQDNLDKLADRMTRDQLHGAGDNR